MFLEFAADMVISIHHKSMDLLPSMTFDMPGKMFYPKDKKVFPRPNAI